MREVKLIQIKDKVKELFLKANFCINQDLMQRLEKALKEESSTIGKHVLQMNIENNKIASREEMPICKEGYLRKSARYACSSKCVLACSSAC